MTANMSETAMAIKSNLCANLAATFGLASAVNVTPAHAHPKGIGDIYSLLASSKTIAEAGFQSIDPAQISLSFDANVSVHFIGDANKYKKSVGWYDAAASPQHLSTRTNI